jgi:hypothetical protein
MLTTALFFAGCQNEDNDVFNVNADVVFLHKIIDNDTLTGVAYYAYGNQEISEVVVTLPENGGTTNLEKNPNSSYTYYFEAPDEEYSDKENFPTGSYIFNVMSADGESLEITEVQEMDEIGFAKLDSSGFDDEQKLFYFEWEEVDNTQSYVALLLNSEGEVIFSGYPVDEESPFFYLSPHYDTGTWHSYPQTGENYTLRIQSYLYDADATNADYVYNIQEISIADYSLEWELD